MGHCLLSRLVCKPHFFYVNVNPLVLDLDESSPGYQADKSCAVDDTNGHEFQV